MANEPNRKPAQVTSGLFGARAAQPQQPAVDANIPAQPTNSEAVFAEHFRKMANKPGGLRVATELLKMLASNSNQAQYLNKYEEAVAPSAAAAQTRNP